MTKRYLILCFVVLLNLLVPRSLFAQTYSDGPIQMKIWVGDIKVKYNTTTSADFTLNIGSFNLPNSVTADELSFYLWARDNANVSGLPWQGGTCLTKDLPMTNGGPEYTNDFGDTLFKYTYTGATVPKYFDLRLKAWQDNIPSDFAPVANLTPCGTVGSRCTYDTAVCCVNVFGNCLLSNSDNNYCDANPYKSQMDYRVGNPCEIYSWGYVAGSGCTNLFYQPNIYSFWRYTKGTSCSDAIDLGTLTTGVTLSHFNSNECYNNNFAGSPGNDVYYSFTVNSPKGVNISLCDPSTTFDTKMYLLNGSCQVDTSDDDGCGNRSVIHRSICTPGTYYVVVDGKTATDMGTFKITITEDTSLTFAANLTKKDATCFGASNGEAYAHITGGIAPYTYNWSGSFPNNDTITGLSAGNYSITVHDNQGCSTTATVAVGQPAQLTVATSAMPVSCGGANNGSVTATPAGGTSPYSYIWNSNPAQTSQTAVLLTAGTYFVTVTDLNGCTVSGSATVSPTTTIVVTTDSVKNVSCFGANDGKIYLSVTGGQQPYVYAWSNSLPAQQDQTGLAPGTYTVTITDAVLCVTNVTFNITEPTQLQTVINSTISANCPDSEDGGADLTVTGGTQPYQFNWSDGSHLNSLFNAAPGSYTVTVTDAHNCTATQAATVTFNGTAITTSIAHTDANCLQDLEGTADLTVSGGAGAYTFYWSNFATTQNVTNLKPGTYSVVVTDANGCVKVDTVTIQELAPDGVCDTTDTIVHPVNDKPYVMVPNAFSPNGDGQNDVFAFYLNHTTTVEVSIFNRTGSLVYHNANQAAGDGWRGRFHDRDAPSGTYVYVLNIKFDDGTVEQKTGSVVLIR